MLPPMAVRGNPWFAFGGVSEGGGVKPGALFGGSGTGEGASGGGSGGGGGGGGGWWRS
jgi:hypothetical protein